MWAWCPKKRAWPLALLAGTSLVSEFAEDLGEPTLDGTQIESALLSALSAGGGASAITATGPALFTAGPALISELAEDLGEPAFDRAQVESALLSALSAAAHHSADERIRGGNGGGVRDGIGHGGGAGEGNDGQPDGCQANESDASHFLVLSVKKKDGATSIYSHSY